MSANPPQPLNEPARLQTLRELEVLDTDPEDRFDRITGWLSDHYDVPIVLVSLVDRERQWFKSRHGLDAAQTPREVAFCAHAILDDVPFVVSDATRDPRFQDNPLVTGAPHVTFYAGVPLLMSRGTTIGTVCLIDHRPRQLPDLRPLQACADQIVAQLERPLRQPPVRSTPTQLRRSAGAVYVIVHGRLSGEGASIWAQRLLSKLTPQTRALHVDVAQCDQVDVLGAHALLQVRSACRLQGIPCTLHATPRLQELLDDLSTSSPPIRAPHPAGPPHEP